MIALLGDLAGILTTVAIIPEIVVVYRKKRANQLSYIWLFVIWVGLALWAIYGIAIGSVPLILFNILSFLLYSILIGLKVVYDKRERQEINSKR